MLRSIGEQSGESVESVPEKKRKATVGTICKEGDCVTTCAKSHLKKTCNTRMTLKWR